MKSTIFSILCFFSAVSAPVVLAKESSVETIYKNLRDPVTAGSDYCRIISTGSHYGTCSVQTIIVDSNGAGSIYIDEGNFSGDRLNISRKIIKLSEADTSFWSGEEGLRKVITALSDFKQKDEPAPLTVEARSNGVLVAKNFIIMDISMYPDPVNRLMELLRKIEIPNEQ